MINDNYCIFYIVRHGETKWNVEGKLQGHADSALTEKGITQAKILGEKLKNTRFDLAFSSDSLRAYKTAEIIALEHKIAVKTTQLLRERSFGKWEGKNYSVFSNELKHLVDKFLSMSDEKKKSFKYPDMESDEEIVARFITFLRETAVAYPGKRILVVTHGAMMRILLIHLGLGTYEEIPPNAVDNGAYMQLQSDGVEFFIRETEGINKH